MGRILVERLSIFAQGMEIYQNTGEGMLETYKDLWRSEEDRKRRQEYGLANENTRKLMSKDDLGDKTTKTDGILDKSIAEIYESLKIRKNHESANVANERRIQINGFTFGIRSDRKREFGSRSKRQTQRRKISRLRYTTLLKTLSWNKDSTLEVIDINIPRKSLKALVLLFTDSDEEDSEHFPFPNLEKVNVTVEGNPNDLYSEGLAKRNMYDEAQRFFGNGLRNSFVSLEKFYVDKFACVLDFRTVDDEKVSGSGRNLIGTQAGILLEIEKKATSKNLACHVFVIADGIIDVVENNYKN